MLNKYIIKGTDDLKPLKEKWERLEKGSDMTFFQSYEWNRLLVENFYGASYNCFFAEIVVYETDHIIAPLLVQKQNVHIRWLGRRKGVFFLGTGNYSDYMNFIYESMDECELKELIYYIRSDNRDLLLTLSMIREDTVMVHLLQSIGFTKSEATVAVSVTLPESEDAYDAMLSKSTRQNLRTSKNRMVKDGMDYQLEYVQGTVNSDLIFHLVGIHLQRVMEINTDKSSIKKYLSSTIRKWNLRRVEMKNNIISSAMAKVERSMLIIARLNGNIAGFMYGFIDDGTIRIVQNCYVDDYKFYSPMFRGAYDFAVNQISSKGFTSIDFTRGGEAYKYKLGGIEIKLYSFHMPPIKESTR